MKKENIPFSGKLVKLQLRTNDIGYGLIPDPNQEVEQRLFLSAKTETAKLKHMNFGSGDRYELASEQVKRDVGNVINEIFEVVDEVFSHFELLSFACDAGEWNLVLTNDEGEQFYYRSYFGHDFVYLGCSVSSILRSLLGWPGLWAFAPTNEEDRIERIDVLYTYSLQIPKVQRGKYEPEFYTEKIAELLTIDRKLERVEITRTVNNKAVVYTKYDLLDEVGAFLDTFEPDELFTHTVGNPKTVMMDKSESSVYQITVTYQEREPLKLIGTFDKLGLPDDWADFASDLKDLLDEFGGCNILNEKLYSVRKRCSDDVIHLKVRFDSSERLYSYRTDNDRIDVGDDVVVPVGKDNEPKIAMVVEKLYYKKDEEPTFDGKIKTVMGLAAPAKLDPPTMPS